MITSIDSGRNDSGRNDSGRNNDTTMTMMLSCKEVTERASHALDESQGFMARLAMRVHLFMCVNCRRYVAHLGLLSEVTRADHAIAEPAEADVERTLNALMARKDEDD